MNDQTAPVASDLIWLEFDVEEELKSHTSLPSWATTAVTKVAAFTTDGSRSILSPGAPGSRLGGAVLPVGGV